jgi:hypothetical protein
MFKKILLSLIVASTIDAMAANGVLQNEYIKAGVNEITGTLGSGGNTSPGLLYNNAGSSTWNTGYDYLTPGSPFEGFTVRLEQADGTLINSYTNNNAGNMSNITGAWVGTPTSSSAVWAGSNAQFNLQHTYSLPSTQKYIDIDTRIEALIAMPKLWFGRFIDPDAVAAAGDSSSTDNVLGYGAISRNNVVFSEATVSRYALGLYSAAPNVKAGITGWSTNPKDYYANGTAGYGSYTSNTYGNGDDTIGLGFLVSGVSVGDIINFRYAYIFGPSAFGAAETAIAGGAGGGTPGTVPGGGTLTDVGSATSSASSSSTPPAPTVLSTSTSTITVSDTTIQSATLPSIIGSIAHHEASRKSGVQTIARETTTTTTTPMERTVVSLVRTTSTWSDSTTTTSDSATSSSTSLFNNATSSVANDSFSGRADQAEQFDIIKTGIYRNLNRQTAKFGTEDKLGRMAINATGVKYNGQNGYNATTSIVGFAYETDLDKDTTIGFQVNKIGSKLDGADTNSASLTGLHVGLYADFNVEGFTIQNDLANANIKNRYSRTIGPFSNSFNGTTNATWLSSRVYTPSLEGFRPFVGGTVYKENTPTVIETGSIQSYQTINGVNKTSTSGEMGLAYMVSVEDVNLGLEIAQTTTGIKEALFNVSKISGDVILSLNLGKNWYQNTTSDVAGVNLKVRF